MVFVHSARSPKDIIYHRELDQMASRIPNFSLHIICEKHGLGEPWSGYRGYLNQRLMELIDGRAAGLEGKLWQAQPVWMHGKTPVVGFKAFPRWVTLMIWNRDGGPAVEDASGSLEVGPRMATRKFSSVAEIDDELVSGWVGQAVATLA